MMRNISGKDQTDVHMHVCRTDILSIGTAANSGKRRRAKRAAALLAAVIMAIACIAPCAAAASAGDSSGYETVKVGYYYSRSFQEGVGDGAMKSGYGYEYMQKIASYTGWKYKYVYGTWSDMYQQLLAGKIDMMAGIMYSDERAQQIAFPDHEMINETFYIYKNDDDDSIKCGDISSYVGKRIGVVKGQSSAGYLSDWMSDNGATAQVVYYGNLDECAADFNSKKLDAFVSADNAVSSYAGISPVEKIGKEPYYICLSEKRSDLLSGLNTALSLMQEQDAMYLGELQNKYAAESSVSVFLSNQEREWLESHETVTVGYLDDYLPYSDAGAGGDVKGLVKDLVPDLFDALPGGYDPEVKYVRFDDHKTMFESLKNGDVDMIFPVGGDTWYAEQEDYQQSSSVVNSSMDIVYKNKFDKLTTSIMAVNKKNLLQYYYTATNFPDAKIVEFETVEDCVKAVRDGKATGTVVNSLRSSQLIDTSYRLNVSPLPVSDERCFGVAFGNSSLLMLLNHGISILGDTYGIDHAYQYVVDLVSYTAEDFVRDNMMMFTLLILILILALTGFAVRRYMNLQRAAQKEAEQNARLQEALERARRAGEARNVFLRHMSHDIRTPLNGILGIIDINSHCSDPEQIAENRLKAKQSADHLLELVDNVLEMTRIESGESQSEYQNVDIQKIVDDVINVMGPHAAEAGVELYHDTRGDALSAVEVYTDPLDLKSIFINVLENAVKYNRRGGSITWTDVLSRGDGSNVTYKCVISDTGIGMDPEYIKHIFEPFSQENAAVRTNYKGVGLGMAIVRSLVDKIGGEISIESHPGEGSRVSITLPFVAAPEDGLERYGHDNNNDNNDNGEQTCRSDESDTASYINDVNKDSGPKDIDQKDTDHKDADIKNENETGAGASAGAAPEAEKAPLTGMKILLAEDNELNMEIAKFMLEDAGADVSTAYDGEEALKMYEGAPEGRFDAVLMDIMMPNMDGYEATRAIRRSGRGDAATIPIIAVTAHAFDEDRRASLATGMNEHLTKPLDSAKLVKTVLHFCSSAA